MKLIPKGTKKPTLKTTIWVEEKKNGKTIKRELFTCYDVTLKDIRKLLLSAMDKK
jgi:hypothetical protein